MNIQWFPGHMAKTRRLITDNLKLVDVVVELLDARIPLSSANPILPELLGNKPKVIALNKSDMADANVTAKWIQYFKDNGVEAVAVSSISGKGFDALKNAINTVLKDKIQKREEKGMKNVPARIMVVGIPNVGKSSFINKLSGRAGAKTGDRPGVTTAKQWIRIAGGYELLDTPGILWPKFDDEITGQHLAFTGAVKDDVYDTEEAAMLLCGYLSEKHSDKLKEIYKLDDIDGLSGYEILECIGRKRGCIVSGGNVDTERASKILLNEFRGCKLGNISLEEPYEQ
ncbi:MAG: ribosome biogenesis GTPase YlqF [Clostridia bacterium]|nr:ribosome biogenesis GTPase YlqF [Clostridia bacterium]MBQ9998017.1 ribosome biogenesis GTPase YlqF [Clostridia bacterium]